MSTSQEQIGGISFSTLNQKGRGEVPGVLSHRPLEYINTERSIQIYDQQDSRLHFIIKVDTDGFLHLDVQSKFLANADEEELKEGKHPDFYARKLTDKSLEIFKARGLEIKGMIAEWFMDEDPAGDNTVEYLDNLAAHMSEKEAALNTWTGRLAQDLGFSNVEQVRVSDRDPHGNPFVIEVIFTKPKS